MSLDDANTYVEKEEGISHTYELTRRLNEENIHQTKRGLVEFVPTKKYGECLFIDNVSQLSIKDEFIYHELLVHPAMIGSSSRSSVCIIGGGDGCAAREVFKWNDVNKVDLVDWDSELIELFKTKYASWNDNSLLNPKLKHICQDINEADFRNGMYNVLIIDLFDPDLSTESNIFHWTNLITNAKLWLAPKGTIVMNAGGVLPWDTKNVEKIIDIIAEHFSDMEKHEIICYKGFVPSFQQEWCFILIQPQNSDIFAPTFVHSDMFRFKYFNHKIAVSCRDWPYVYMNIPKKPVKLNNLKHWIQSRQYD